MITSKKFDVLDDGREITEYILKNSNGMEVHVLSYACIVKDIIIPKDGKNVNVVLGWNSIDEYYFHGYKQYYFGSFVGRVANRISNSSFSLNGMTYALTPNEGPNHLHGIFRDTVFRGEIVDDAVVFSYYSTEADESYPGNLSVACMYSLSEENDLCITYQAGSDADTPVNFTNHIYFNLNGRDSGDVFDQLLEINANAITETDSSLLPTGRLLDVEGTPYDFRVMRPISDHLYDDNFCLSPASSAMKIAAQAIGDKSGIKLYCGTTEIGLQVYSGLKTGFTLETQHYPDAPNRPEFPSITLRKDDKYLQQTIYKFEW